MKTRTRKNKLKLELEKLYVTQNKRISISTVTFKIVGPIMSFKIWCNNILPRIGVLKPQIYLLRERP